LARSANLFRDVQSVEGGRLIKEKVQGTASCAQDTPSSSIAMTCWQFSFLRDNPWLPPNTPAHWKSIIVNDD
jgi:hypothetical protein